MAAYLYQVAYTPEAWANLTQSPQDRMEAIKPAVEQMDGTVIAGGLCFGEYDLIAIVDWPDNVTAVLACFDGEGLDVATATDTVARRPLVLPDP